MKTVRWMLAGLLVLAMTAPLQAAGFGIFEQGTKAMGMAGAFTAQADDGSAMFHNVGGLAFQHERNFQVGTTLITNTKQEFKGENPFPGEGVTENGKDQVFFPSHVYWVQPVGETLTFGFGFSNPFGLTTEWENPDEFTGRFISYKASLRTFDLNPSLGWQVSDTFGVGIGLVFRFSDLELNRRQATINPFTGRAEEIANVGLEGGLDEGYGFNVGLLHKWNNSFQWGLSYRSKIETDYTGDATFTQLPTGNPILDGIVSGILPPGKVGIATSIETPDMASIGFLFALSQNTRLEIDVNWTGWSSFDELVVNFDEESGVEDLVSPQNWEDVWNYRIGFLWNAGSGQWRFGYVYDETPQPKSVMSPLLPDANRNGFTVGYGFGGQRLTTDLALMYLPFDERGTDGTSIDGYDGTYNTTAWLFGVTLGWK